LLIIFSVASGNLHELKSQEALSQEGRFRVDFGSGCTPLTINVTNLSDQFTGDPQYTYFTGDTQTLDTFHTYTDPGQFTIVQFGPRPTNELRDTLIIEVFEPLQPDFNVLSCGGTTATVDITDEFYDRYRVFFTPNDSVEVAKNEPVPTFTFPGVGDFEITVEGLFNGGKTNCGKAGKTFDTQESIIPATVQSLEVIQVNNINGEIRLTYNLPAGISYSLQGAPPNRTNNFSTISTLQDTNSFTIQNLNTTDFFHCFRIVAFDACTNNAISSDTICSVALSVANINELNQLEWIAPVLNFSSFSIVKNGEEIASLTDPTPMRFTDNAIVCNREDCYEVIYNYSNGLTADSGEGCIVASNVPTPPIVNNVTASVVNEEININWEIPESVDAVEYAVDRGMGPANFSFLDSVNSTQFSDTNVNSEQKQFCYRIQYRDACGNLSGQGVSGCPVFLSRRNDSRIEVALQWTEYRGWANGVNSYSVEELDENGNILGATNVGLSRNYSRPVDGEMQRFFFRIMAVSNDSEPLVSFSNILEVNLQAEVILPNAFFPEGNNNVLEVMGFFVKSFEMKIFSRWGELIHFSNQNSEGWDGRMNDGEIAPMGSYIYIIDFTDFKDDQFTKQGSVFLIRR